MIFFSCGIDVLPEYLHKLFNVLFDKGYFPSSWAEGHIIPIHKKGSVDSPENYRGVTLLSTLGKLFTKILNSRLTEWAENYGVYIEAQAGFRSKMGTTDNIFVLHGLITHLINEGKKLYCAFVDFRKAFDFVNRDILWFKLIKIGVRGKILNVMRGMYSSVKSRVKYQNELSSEFECYLGVRQGECLSPFLFSMYINDIEDEFYLHGINGIEIDTIKVFLLLYADNITIFAETAEGLQEGLNLLSNYCTRWKLILNTDKTKVMVFRKGGILPRNLKFYYDETELEIVSSFSYLGIIFSTGGSFSNAQKTLAGQAQKAVFKLNSYLYNFDTLTTRHILELFDKLVSPILNYGAEVWGFFKANQIERAHLQFCKRLLGVKKCTQNNFIYGELGRLPYQKQRYFIIIKYWLKIVNSEENKMIKHVYNQMLLDLELDNRRVNWASLVKKLLSELGFYEVWLQQNVGDHQMFLAIFKQRVRDSFIQTWNSELAESSMALFFRNTSDFGFKAYLNIVTVKKFRRALSRLRMSSHRLEVEMGRWKRPVKVAYGERKCRVCGVLEDEFHFLIECPIYVNLRAKYIKRYYYISPSMYKLVELFSTNNNRDIQNLATYVYKAFDERNKTLYLRNT